MFNFFKKKREAPLSLPPMPASVGQHRRIYAIGDIHGRADLFSKLLTLIEMDYEGRETLPTQIILLGDLVDRGPSSAEVVANCIRLAESGAPVRFLKGNHEEVFLRAAKGDEQATRFFTRIGGRETILSYGLDEETYNAMDYEALTQWLLNSIPRAHVDFLEGFEDLIEIGDYVFVHAGIRPEVPLAEQKPSDLRWIRDDFLSYREPLGRLIVHGHTITPGVDEQVNRIGIDTGAYQSGRLTAIGLEHDQRWYLSAVE